MIDLDIEMTVLENTLEFLKKVRNTVFNKSIISMRELPEN
jgi:hypothetical protein